MPPPYIWTSMVRKQDASEVDTWLDRSRSFRTPTSHPVRCQLCSINHDNHHMRYRVITCTSSTCDVFVGETGEWRQKILTCLDTGFTDIYQHGRHLTNIASPRKPTLTREMKTFVEPLIAMRMKPNRVYNQVLDHFGHTIGESPKLSQVQTFVGHYKSSVLNETDFIDDMVQLAKNTQFRPDMPDAEAFTFGYGIGDDGAPAIGEGVDDDPTLLGISTPYMMKTLRYARDHVFHIDTTYKLNQSGYPVLVVGVSDLCRSFHPVAMFLTSQQTGEIISSALGSLFDMYKLITGAYPSLRYCMGDADKAQYKAVVAVASTKRNDTRNVVFLMCFFHVIKNVSDRVSKLPLDAVSLVFKHLYQMHYSRDATEFKEQTELALAAWKAVTTLHSFAEYFEKQWINSQFSNWACYHSPTGFATTNNPVEQFNNAIKRDYSLRTLLKLVALAEQLTLMCRHRSRGTIEFSLECKPDRELHERHKYLQNHGRLSVSQPHKHGLDFLLEDARESHIAYVYQRGAPPRHPMSDQPKEKNRSDKRNKHRMELLDQPVGGWRVDLDEGRCQCRAWYKYGICAHIIAALRHIGRNLPGEKPQRKRFANRRIKRKGRNASVGPALSLE